MIDPNIEPSVEVDETSDILDIVWRSSDGNESFSVVASGGKLIGISCTVEPPRSRVAWSVNLPAGLLTVDHTKMHETR